MAELMLPAGAFLTRVTAPTEPLLTVEDMRQHSAIDHYDDDAILAAYISAATDMVDARDGELGRALVNQTWRLAFPAFPASGRFDLPLPPVQSITSVSYYDADNADQTLASSAYRLTIQDDFARVDLVSGSSWPTVYDRADAVRVDYLTGYGEIGADVPDAIRQAARLMVDHWLNERGAATTSSLADMPYGVKFLLHKFRVVRGLI